MSSQLSAQAITAHTPATGTPDQAVLDLAGAARVLARMKQPAQAPDQQASLPRPRKGASSYVRARQARHPRRRPWRRLLRKLYVARRRAGRRWLQRLISARRFVFIEETWAKTSMTRLRGWCRRGQRLIGKGPHGHWETLTLVAALRHDGIIAPCVFDGPINAQSFLAHVRAALVPALRPSGIVVLDTLSSHKGDQVRQAIRTAGARLVFLPPHSPDLNPIEQVFAKLKELLRKKDSRSVEQTWRSIGDVLTKVTPDKCRRYIANAGYAST